MNVYADNAATTAVSDAAVAAMLPCFQEFYGNPSSLYTTGQLAAEKLAAAREIFARCLNAQPREITFTSGGSEADNQALRSGAAMGARKGKKHIISTKFEHHAILHTLQALEKEGYEVTLLDIPPDGVVTAQQVKDAIRPDTCLVSIMFANNEIGTIQPIGEIGDVCREAGVLFHTDAVQAAGHLAIDVEALHIDMLSLSAHKFHGPKGVGVLYARRGIILENVIYGGAQERGKRAGTENVPGICALGLAAKLMNDRRAENFAHFTALRQQMITNLSQSPAVCINSPSDAAPYIVNCSVQGIRSEVMIHYLEQSGIYVSGGSACAKGERSHVLSAMGFSHDRIDSAIRISMTDTTTSAEIDELCRCLLSGEATLTKQR